MRRFALLLFFGLALGQTLLPVEELGLTFREEGGAWGYQGGGKRFVYDQIGQVLRAAGGDLNDLVKTIEYITPPALAGYRDVDRVRREVLGRPFPASTGVVVDALLSRSWMIEVEAVAVLS